MAEVQVPAGESVKIADGLSYSVAVKNTGDGDVTVNGETLGTDGQTVIYPVAYQEITASSEKGTTLEVTNTGLGSAEPVTTEAVSHDEPAADQPMTAQKLAPVESPVEPEKPAS